ncbi:unnamed protein product, partial [Amoebophrya sp. A25]
AHPSRRLATLWLDDPRDMDICEPESKRMITVREVEHILKTTGYSLEACATILSSSYCCLRSRVAACVALWREKRTRSELSDWECEFRKNRPEYKSVRARVLSGAGKDYRDGMHQLHYEDSHIRGELGRSERPKGGEHRGE